MSNYSEFRAQTRRRRRKRRMRRALLLVFVAVLICALAWVITWIIKSLGGDEPQSKPQPGSAAPSSETGTQPEQPGSGEPFNQEAGWNVVGPVQRTLDDTILDPDYRMIALPENGRVDNSYFAGTMLIGDSVSQGFGIYETDAKDLLTLCTYKSCGPNTILTNGVLESVERDPATGKYLRVPTQDDIAAKMATKQPEHIYILFGANSLKALTDENFLIYYEKLLDWIQSIARSDAQIYIQSLTPVTAAYEAGDGRYNQMHLYQLNNALAKMAYERGLYFVDLHEALAGDDGYMLPEYAAADGLHMAPEGYRAWLDCLATHTAYSPTIPYLEGSPYYKG